MRQITQESVSAFLAGTNLNKANMSVFHDSDGSHMHLHGNSIAFKDNEGNYWISNAGWESNTTKERLNGLIQVLSEQRGLEPRAIGQAKIGQRNFQWFWQADDKPFPSNQFVRV